MLYTFNAIGQFVITARTKFHPASIYPGLSSSETEPPSSDSCAGENDDKHKGNDAAEVQLSGVPTTNKTGRRFW